MAFEMPKLSREELEDLVWSRKDTDSYYASPPDDNKNRKKYNWDEHYQQVSFKGKVIRRLMQKLEELKEGFIVDALKYYGSNMLYIRFLEAKGYIKIIKKKREVDKGMGRIIIKDCLWFIWTGGNK